MMLHDEVVFPLPFFARLSLVATTPRNLHQLGNMFLVKYVRTINSRGTKNT